MEEKEIIEILKDFNDIKLERDKLEIEKDSYKMGEEDIIEEIKEWLKHETNFENLPEYDARNLYMTVKGLLDLYNKEKEKNSKQFAEIENLKKEIFELNKEMSDFADQWLHKYKIREKIKKLENEFHFYAGRDPYEWDDSEFDGDVCDTLCQQIKVLKELLEEEE